MVRVVVAVMALALSAQAAHAEIKVVRHLRDWTCMKVAVAPEQNADPRIGAPVRDAPMASNPVTSWTPSIVVVSTTEKRINGFVQVLLLTNRTGWVQVAALVPWSNPYAPNRRCYPSAMSDGSIGYDIKATGG